MEDDGEVSLPPPTEDGAEKHEEGNENLVDRISELPHEVLVSVLSLLTMKEAARTSVLSRRWRKLWTHAMIDLNFEDSRTRDDILHNRISLKVGRFRFIGWVNRVLYSHQGSCLRELRVCFDLSNRCRRYVDVWISIALAKKVQNLELDFSPFLKKNSSVCYMLPGIAIPPRTGRHFDWSSLRSLCIRYVYVTGEILECILTRCPFLERLLVRGAEHLCSLKVTGSSLSLKHLDVYCKYLVYFEVSAPYLISFHYLNDTKRVQQLHIKNAPLLTDVSFGVVYEPISVYLRPVFNYLHQLETLQLYLVLYKDGLDIPKFPELTNLRNLTWVVHTSDTGSLLQLTSLIEAAPFLHTFTLGLSWTEPWVWRRRIAKKQVVTSNEYLKMVKIVGFRGHAVDFELILYLLEKATMLEEIVIDLRDFVTGAFPTEEEQAVRNRAGLLKQWLPHKLIVL